MVHCLREYYFPDAVLGSEAVEGQLCPWEEGFLGRREESNRVVGVQCGLYQVSATMERT